MRRLWLCGSMVVALAACEQSNTQKGEMGVGDDLGVGGDDLSVLDGPISSGALAGEVCATNASCCGGMCDPTALICLTTTGMCKGPGEACVMPTDCCNLSCNNGTCSMATMC